MLRLMILGALVALAAGQFKKVSSDRVLESPIAELCAQRTIHERFNGKGYYYSWADPRTAGIETDWLSVRNFCRQRCMDSVSLETDEENTFIKKRVVKDDVQFIWTSGRLCDFDGCDRIDLLPPRINGWFWTATLQKLFPTTNRENNDWSENGGIKQPQPDNREVAENGTPENCIALLNEFYKDGVHWHDVACHHKKPWVCEENKSLLEWARFKNPNIRI